MAQEEQPNTVTSSHSAGGGGGDRSRNVKQKKIPQRGLGVAQLEKIRVEEQRKKAAIEAANAIGSVTVAARSVSPAPVDFYASPPVQMNGAAAEDAAGWCRLWSGDYGHRNASALRPPPVNFQSESSAAAASPAIGQRFILIQQPASPVNLNPSPSAVLMEPPSNQNMHCNSYATTSSWQEEYKIVGVKRPYPFSLESPPARYLPAPFDPSSVSSKSRCDDDGAQTEPRNAYTRYYVDGPSNPSPLPEQNPGEAVREGGRRLNGDFLTLALLPSDSKHIYAIDSPGSQGPEENNIRRVEHLGAMEEPFSFFPIRSDVEERNGNGEKGEAIDLNLKL